MKPLKSGFAFDSLTCLSYGGSGSGKTEFLATWPYPVIFSAAAERGHVTVQFMDPNKLYDPKWPLLNEKIYPVSTLDDFNQIVPIAREEVQKRGAKTIGIDSTTFMVNLLVGSVSAKGYDLWAEVLAKMTNLRTQLYSLGVRVVWTAAQDQDSKGPAIQGQTAVQLPHCCDMILYHTAEEDVANRRTTYRAWTAPKGGYPARHRFGDKLSNPLGRWEKAADGNGEILIPEVSFRSLEASLKQAS